jgi:hypothetical protein
MCLQTCPFPYIKLNKPEGYTWTDSMSMGAHWSNEMWGEWTGRLLMKYSYSITGKETVNTKLGDLYCTVIEATAGSIVGRSKLTAYYSEKYRFVILNYTLFNGNAVKITLDRILNKSQL